MSELLITIGVLFIGAIVGIGGIILLLHFLAALLWKCAAPRSALEAPSSSMASMVCAPPVGIGTGTVKLCPSNVVDFITFFLAVSLSETGDRERCRWAGGISPLGPLALMLSSDP